MTSHRSKLGAVLAGTLLAFAAGRTTAVGADDLVASAEEVSPVLVGTTVPDGPLKTADGQETTLGELRAGQPTVLVFYRGFW